MAQRRTQTFCISTRLSQAWPFHPRSVLSCPAISLLCLGTGHLPAEVGGTCWPDAAVWLLELFQMPGQCPTHQQGSMRGPRADPLLPSRKTQPTTRAGGKQEDKATSSPGFSDKTAGGEGRPGPGTSESPPAQVCPWWRKTAPACDITKQGRLGARGQRPPGAPGAESTQAVVPHWGRRLTGDAAQGRLRAGPRAPPRELVVGRWAHTQQTRLSVR